VHDDLLRCDAAAGGKIAVWGDYVLLDEMDAALK